jgi:hypothetical protein
MAGRFKKMSLEEFIVLINRFPFSRRVNAVHMHHTWRPNRQQYQGEDSIEGMWRYHTQHNGWRDIAQHVTIAPDGTIWTGRDWNLAPASASGHNGNGVLGPFMFEMIGDFDRGRDPFDGEQRRAALHVTAHVLHRFGLPAEALHFHREMSTKTCPGNGIDYDATVAEVRTILAGLGARGAAPADAGADEALLALLHGPMEPAATRSAPQVPTEGEPAEETMSAAEEAELTGTPRGLFGPAALLPQTMALLRHHVVNLDQGQFSDRGQFQTTAADVDALFDQHLEAAWQNARAAGRPLHLLFYAHGGLVSEESGLESAATYIPWWLANHIYPIYFVWETGLAGTLGALLRGQRAPRGLSDLSDHLLEGLVRLPGRPVWKNMKDSAEWAAAPGGGSQYVAQKLAEFCQRHPAELADGTIQLHAVGHSAGSILHAHFLPEAWKLGVPAFRGLHLLAPAIRTDEFQRRLAPHVGSNIEQLTMYTMHDALELKDNCASVYRKSLLYLIHFALEYDREAAILGLETSVRADAALCQLFALNAGATSEAPAEVIWSQTTGASRRASSTSTTHGGFDNDGPTMESVARRVLNQDNLEAPFPRARALADMWREPVALPPALLQLAQQQLAQSGISPQLGDPPASQNGASSAAAGPARAPAPRSTRRALCIGIDNYPDAPLNGCVADARNWHGALTAHGFTAQLLVNEQATRAAVLDRLGELVSSSQPGDVVVVQYSGHGTQVPDTNDDEADNQDEALCAYDYATGGLVLDDDLRNVFSRIPTGVNLTCFMDCCNSGSNTRALLMTTAVPAGARRRYLQLTEPQKENFLRQHPAGARRAATRTAAGRPGGEAVDAQADMREISFAACQDNQFAYEYNNEGIFTKVVLPLLTSGQVYTHRQLLAAVKSGFSPLGYNQNPMLNCAADAYDRLLLQAWR